MGKIDIERLNNGNNPLFRVQIGDNRGFNVTLRQIKIINLISQGFKEKEIALALNISRDTVKKAKGLSFEETEIDSQVELTVLFFQLGLIWPISILGLESFVGSNGIENEI
jgi:DNA-binding CsgD family transcriptional regulator